MGYIVNENESRIYRTKAEAVKQARNLSAACYSVLRKTQSHKLAKESSTIIVRKVAP